MITFPALIQFTELRLNTLCLNFERTYSNPSEGAIHDLRVSIRRFLTHLNFLSFLYDQDEVISEQYRTQYKKLKRCLKSLNQLRDLQIQIQYIENHSVENHVPVKLLEMLKCDEAARLSRLSFKMDAWNLRKIRIKIRHLLREYPVGDKELELKCHLYFNYLAEEAHSAVNDCKKPDILGCHRLRIRLKECRYHLEMLEQGFDIKQLLIGAIKNWQDELGALQDMRMLLEKLHQMNTVADPELHGFTSHVESELNALLETVRNEVHAIRFEIQLK